MCPFHSQEPLLFVIGNESCDLDSAVSAISLAYYHSNAGHSISTYRNKYRLLPLLNIPRVNLPLKTEVTHFLTQNSIELDNVICRLVPISHAPPHEKIGIN